MINKILPSTHYNSWWKSLDTNQDTVKVPKVFLRHQIKEYISKTLGTSVIYSPLPLCIFDIDLLS